MQRFDPEGVFFRQYTTGDMLYKTIKVLTHNYKFSKIRDLVTVVKRTSSIVLPEENPSGLQKYDEVCAIEDYSLTNLHT